MGLTQKQARLDEKTLQNVAFVMLLLQRDIMSWLAWAEFLIFDF